MDCIGTEAGEGYYADLPTLLSIKFFNINCCRILLKFGLGIRKQCCSFSIMWRVAFSLMILASWDTGGSIILFHSIPSFRDLECPVSVFSLNKDSFDGCWR